LEILLIEKEIESLTKTS